MLLVAQVSCRDLWKEVFFPERHRFEGFLFSFHKGSVECRALYLPHCSKKSCFVPKTTYGCVCPISGSAQVGPQKMEHSTKKLSSSLLKKPNKTKNEPTQTLFIPALKVLFCPTKYLQAKPRKFLVEMLHLPCWDIPTNVFHMRKKQQEADFLYLLYL